MRASQAWVRSVLLAASLPVIASAQTVVFSENFDGGTGVGRFDEFSSSTPDNYQTNYNYNYSTYQYKLYSDATTFTTQPIPPAPGGSTTTGLRIGFDRPDGVSLPIVLQLLPKLADSSHPTVSENFKISFNMWMNYNGPALGGSNSTETMTAGLNKDGTGVAGYAPAGTTSANGYTFRVAGEGGNGANDYQVYSSDQAGDGPSYSKINATWPGTTENRYNHSTGSLTSATATDIPGDQRNSYFDSVFPTPDYETLGAPGKHWVSVVIEQHGNIVDFTMNGKTILTHYLDTVASGVPTFGYADPFTTDAGAVQDEQFILYDNIVATQLAPLSKFNATSGAYSNSANWSAGVPNGPGMDALFEGAAGGASISVNSPVELRSMSFNSPDTYTLGGSSTITLSGITSTLYTSAGSHTVSAPVKVTGHLSICNLAGSSLTLSNFTQDITKNISKTGDGTLVLNKIRANGVTLTSGVLKLMTNGGTSRVNNLQLPTDYTPILDLTNNAMIVDYTLRTLSTDPTKNNDPFVSFRQLVANGFHGGDWNPSGRSITSSTAASVMNDGSDPHKTAVGYAEASILLGPSGGTFNGEAVDGSAILLKYTYLGDSNLDGNVNALDFNALASNFGTSVVTGAFKPSWTEGDYNFDGTVDSSDFTAMAVNFNLALPAPALGTLIPEPCGLAAVALIVGLRIRRRSSRRF